MLPCNLYLARVCVVASLRLKESEIVLASASSAVTAPKAALWDADGASPCLGRAPTGGACRTSVVMWPSTRLPSSLCSAGSTLLLQWLPSAAPPCCASTPMLCLPACWSTSCCTLSSCTGIAQNSACHHSANSLSVNLKACRLVPIVGCLPSVSCCMQC